MAEVAEMPAELKNSSESVPRKKRQSTLPKPDAKTLQPEAFYKYTQGLTDTDWPHVIIYVWRQWPRIIREPKYIDKLSSAVTEEYLLSHHGSGKYWLALNDTDTDQTICQTYPEFDNPNHPPLLDLRELDVAHDKNRTFVDHLKRTGKLTMDGEVVQTGRDSSTNTEANGITQIALEAMRMNREAKPGIENQAFSKMMDMMSNASAKSIEIAMSQVKKEDPSGFLSLMIQMMNSQQTTLTTLLTKLLEGNNGKGSDPMIALMMKQIEFAEKRAELAEARAAEERKSAEAEKQRAHEKELKAMENQAKQASPTAMVKEVLELQRDIAQLGSDEPRNWKEKLVDQGLQYVPDILDVAKKAFSGGGYPRQQPNGQQPVQQRPPAQQHQPQPVQQQQPQPMQQQQQPPVGETQMPQPPSDPEIAFLLDIFYKAGERFVQAFQTDPNTGGHHVAKDVAFYGGLATYERIARMGREKILQTIQLVMVNGEAVMYRDLMRVGTVEMLNDFIDDFIDGPEPPDDDEDDDSDQEPGKTDPIEERAQKPRVTVKA